MKKVWTQYPEIVVAVFGFFFVLWTIMVPHMIGLADQGDFIRSMQSFGIAHLSNNPYDEYLHFANRFFKSGLPPTHIHYFSSVVPLITVALWINNLMHKGLFDIEVMGVLYTALFSFAIYLLIKAVYRMTSSTPLTYIAGAVVLFIFGDIGYTSYFNSFFEEPISYVTYLLMAGFAFMIVSTRQKGVWSLVGFGISAMGFLTAKEQDLPMLLPLLALGIWLAFMHRGIGWKSLCVSILISLTVLSTVDYTSTNSMYNRVNVYESVFRGVLVGQSAQTVRQDLKWFHVNPKYAALADTSWWTKHKPYDVSGSAFKRAFFDKVHHGTVVEFYLTHPVRLYEALQASTVASVQNRPLYLGNYPKSSGYPPGAVTQRMALWSDFKRRFEPRSLWVLLLYYVCYFGVLIASYRPSTRKGRNVIAVLIAIGVTSIIEFPVPYVGEGITELTKHMFIFNVIVDFMVGVSVIWLIYRIITRIRNRRDD